MSDTDNEFSDINLDEEVRFYNFRLNGKVLSVAGTSRADAKMKFEAHLDRHKLSDRAKAHFSTTGQPHPDAHKVIHEGVEMDLEEALDLQQRRERAMILRRNKMKIQRARELAQHKMASGENIKKRAYNQARKMVRNRVVGKKAADYEKLGPSEKIIIDKAVEKKKKLIKKLALRLIPRVKQDEQKRLQTFLHGDKLTNQGAPEGQTKVAESINDLFNEQFPIFSTKSKNEKSNVSMDDDTASKQRERGKPMPGNKAVVMYSKFGDAAMKESATYKALIKKADKHDIDIEVLGEVFDRGYNTWTEDLDVTAEQHAFARVNSFVNKGKSYFEEDADLQEISTDTLDSYITKASNDRTKQTGNPRKYNNRLKGIAQALKKGNDQIDNEGPKKLKPIKTEYERQMDDSHRHIYGEGFKNWKFEFKAGDRTKVLSGDHKGKRGTVVSKHDNGAVYTIKHEDGSTMKHHISTLHEPILKEARPNNPEYDESEKAWNERKKDFEKNFDSEGKPKKPKSKIKEEIDYEKMNTQVKMDRELRSKYKGFVKTPHGPGMVYGHDHDKKDHVIIHYQGGGGVRSKNAVDAGTERSVHMKDIKESLDESNNKPYVKPHLDSTGKHVGWKASNQHGKVKYFGKDFRGSAERHAGPDLKEEIEKVGTYMTKDGAKLTLHRNSDDRKHHMLVNHKGISVKGFYKPTEDVHKDLTGNDHNLSGALHEIKESSGTLARKKMQTVERPDDIDDVEGDHPKSTKSASNRHQQIVKKIVEQQLDPKKREVGTDELTKTYKKDTPGENSLKETAFSSDKKPVVVPGHKDAHGNDIPAKTVMRRTKRAIINKNDNPNDGN